MHFPCVKMRLIRLSQLNQFRVAADNSKRQSKHSHVRFVSEDTNCVKCTENLRTTIVVLYTEAFNWYEIRPRCSDVSGLLSPWTPHYLLLSRLVLTQDRGALISAWSRGITTVACLVILRHGVEISPLIIRYHFN